MYLGKYDAFPFKNSIPTQRNIRDAFFHYFTFFNSTQMAEESDQKQVCKKEGHGNMHLKIDY